jgi:phage gp29-like protein
MAGPLQGLIKNAFNYVRGGKNSKKAYSSLSNYITPVQLLRMAHDVGMWRQSVSEAELAYFPYRVRMQRMFNDTILNGHVGSLMERRKDLSLLRDFEVLDPKGKPSEALTQMFTSQEWFNLYLEYALDAKFYGYSLIELGDLVMDKFSDLSIVPRWNISPDRHEMSSFVYMPHGYKFMEDPWADWHIWVPTPTQTGASKCGYGLLYNIALYEIILKNTLGYNSDFVELYSQPYRVGKTSAREGEQRQQMENALSQMGSSGWAVIDPTDEIEFLETALAGTGWKGYENLEQRCEKKVSKIILGHADAVDSIPGKLGSGQNPDDPVQVALRDKQTKDGRLLTALTNEQLFPKLRKIGFNIPEGAKWQFKNDKELKDTRVQEDKDNMATATIAQTMKNAGLQMDPKYFQDRTGIPTTKMEVPDPLNPDDENNKDSKGKDKKPMKESIKNKLDRLYR